MLTCEQNGSGPRIKVRGISFDMLMCLSFFEKKTKLYWKEERSKLETTKNNSDLDWDIPSHKLCLSLRYYFSQLAICKWMQRTTEKEQVLLQPANKKNQRGQCPRIRYGILVLVFYSYLWTPSPARNPLVPTRWQGLGPREWLLNACMVWIGPVPAEANNTSDYYSSIVYSFSEFLNPVDYLCGSYSVLNGYDLFKIRAGVMETICSLVSCGPFSVVFFGPIILLPKGF